MNDLRDYYERLYQVIMADVDLLLVEIDPIKRSTKGILERLEQAEKCQDQITKLAPAGMDSWNQLSAAARDRIIKIIEEDLGR